MSLQEKRLVYEKNLYLSNDYIKEIQIKLSIDDIAELKDDYIKGIKIKTDDKKIIDSVYFETDYNNYTMKLILCSGQTNYWLEICLYDDNNTDIFISEPFFDLNFNDELIAENKYGSIFKIYIKMK